MKGNSGFQIGTGVTSILMIFVIIVTMVIDHFAGNKNKNHMEK